MSVIVPAFRAASMLPATLGALVASSLPRESWELILVDDGSDDDTPFVATRYADRVIRLPGRANGPAFARNRGAHAARGELLAFIDADVVVHHDTLERLAESFRYSNVSAVFGAYDEQPAAQGIVSRYRNLMHHYVHTINAGDAETFWAGCGAVRRNVFEVVGGFDEQRYRQPQIEDIELGHRIRDIGGRVVLDAGIQCTHLKHWSLRGMVMSDIRHRGVPWVELLLEERGNRSRVTTLNLQPSEKIYTIFVCAAVPLLLLGIVLQKGLLAIVAAVLIAVVIIGNARLLGWFWNRHGAAMTLAAIPLRLVQYLINGISVAWGVTKHMMQRGSATRRDRSPIAFTGNSGQLG